MGFVYVLSNRSLPELHKVGFTTRSIKERLAELNSSTSIPTAFNVEYQFEVDVGKEELIEQKAHAILKDAGRHQGKEYFHCSAVECREAISVAAIMVNVDLSQKLEAEERRRRVESDRLEQKRIEAENKRLDAPWEQQRQQLLTQFTEQLSALAEPGNFWFWWIGGVVLSACVFDQSIRHASDVGGVFISALAGFVFAVIGWAWRHDALKNSKKYKAAE